MATTLQQLRNVVYDILREEQDSSAYPYSLVDLLINSSQQRICMGRVINPLTKEETRKWELPFLQTTQYYTNQNTTSLTADTTVWATSLSVWNTTNYPTAWNLYISWDIITYTWTTATSFTWVSGVSFAFTSWTSVSLAFALPSDYASTINLIYNNKFKVQPKLYTDMFEDLNSIKWNTYSRNTSTGLYNNSLRVKPFYTIIKSSYLVLFNLNNTDAIVQLSYNKKPTVMTISTDESIIDDDIYAQTTIPYMAVWEMLYNRWEEWRAGEIINFWIWQIKEMYSYYTNKWYENISWWQYKTAKSRLNI